MKAKVKPKTIRRKKAVILPAITTAAAEIAPVARQAIRRGNKFFAKAFVATGIPEGYSETAAWFAERVVLAMALLVAISFSSGVLFVLYLSEPIGDSQFYNSVSKQALLAEEGIKVYSQQVIDITSPIFAKFVKDNRTEDEILAAQVAERVEKLRTYLASKNSPFADDDEALKAFASSKNMKLMVAISFVESTFGQHCYYYNCSGIGGTPPNLRKYDSYAEWIQDFDQLLEDRYKDLPVEKFIGLYVQPGSPSWIYGVKQVIREFDEHQIESSSIT